MDFSLVERRILSVYTLLCLKGGLVSYDKFLSNLDSFSPMMEELQTLSNFVQNKIIEISPEEKTTKFYHYTSVQGLEGIVSNANLWATDYRF